MFKFIKRHWLAYLIGAALAILLGAGASVLVGIKGSTPDSGDKHAAEQTSDQQLIEDELNQPSDAS